MGTLCVPCMDGLRTWPQVWFVGTHCHVNHIAKNATRSGRKEDARREPLRMAAFTETTRKSAETRVRVSTNVLVDVYPDRLPTGWCESRVVHLWLWLRTTNAIWAGGDRAWFPCTQSGQSAPRPAACGVRRAVEGARKCTAPILRVAYDHHVPFRRAHFATSCFTFRMHR